MQNVYITIYLLNKDYGIFLEKCLESLLNQSNKNFELIIVDNASKDNSRELLSKKYDTLNVIYLEKSLRLTEVGNMISKIAKGTHFVRLDADDWVEEDFVETFYDKLKKNTNLAAIFPNYHEVNIDGKIIKTVKRFDFDSEVSLFDLPAHGACTLISKKVFEEIGGYDETLDRQDGYDLWLKLIKNYKVSNIKKPLFYYRQHNLNLTKSQKKLLEVRTDILYKHALQYGLKLENVVFIVSIQRHDDFFGYLANTIHEDKTVLNHLLDKVFSINKDAVICISSESSEEDFSIGSSKILFHKRQITNQSLKYSLVDAVKYVETFKKCNFEYVVSLTIDYPFLDSHYILAAISYIHYFNTDSVDSVCIEDSILFKHNGHTLEPVYNNTITRFERDTLYKRAGGINVLKTSKLDEYDGISTKKTGHIIIDKLSSIRADNIEIMELLDTKEQYR
ncbi:glycosyltransferase [Poseidonibacter ostreae]|uniref:Glycosyltransferase n=1 Tax=Poseidonibacter ostreae TaxID=2654171 RepID=A0A6L4WVK3_9BACT|nr:glycosyltransferase [Poseidonibacter ostreae]KAB7889779.1 glycosyltransferase [Poseidonibacter ostreae]